MAGRKKIGRKQRRALMRQQRNDPSQKRGKGDERLWGVLRANALPLAGVFLLALVLRLVVWMVVTNVNVRPLYDETMYLQRSLGAAEVVSAITSGRRANDKAWDAWIGKAVFPPLHPLILATGQMFSMNDVSGARLVTVLTSSATTVLVFLLTFQVTRCRKAALLAAAIYAVYPSFIGYSHYLWTEPSFIFVLLAGTISTVAMFESSSRRATYGFAVVAGICVGGMALIRAAGMPLVLAFPAYVIWGWYRRKGWSGASFSAVFAVALLVTIAPWQMTLRMQTGQGGMMTNVNQMSLYMGNNPWVPMELGAAFPTETRSKVFASIRESDESPTRMAIREMTSKPGTTLLRMLARVRMLISPDYWVVRHAIKARYSPMSTNGFLLLSLLFFLTYWLLVGLIIRGLIEPNATVHHRWLLLFVTLAMAAGPILTVARCRYHQPMLVVMLPFAAIGALNLAKTVSRKRAMCGAIAFGIFLLMSASAIPVVFRWSLRPSTYYHELISYLPGESGKQASFEDVVMIRARNGPPLGERFRLDFPHGRGRLLFSQTQMAAVEIVTVNPTGTAEMVFIDRSTGESTTVRPIDAAYWQQFGETSIPGIDVMWTGPL